MTNADVARLAVQLDLTGNFSSALGSAEQKLGTFSSGAMSRATSAFGSLEKAASRVGGALGHAGHQLKGLITGPLGVIGLTGGLLSFGGAIEATLGKLNDLAFGTEKLSAITGDSAASLSTLIASTEKYGITVDRLAVIAGFYEKTAGKLNETTAKGAKATKSAELQNLELIKNERIAAGLKTTHIDKLIKEQKATDAIAAATAGVAAGVSKLAALQKQYGVSLVDASGKAVSFNTALLNVADYYSKATDKAKAATLAATLFGRSWQTLAPVLQLGKQGILELEQQAAAMGLQLSEGNIADFARYREAVRGSQEAISGLEVAIGLDLLPTITDLAKGLQSFVTDHKTDIVTFFHRAVDAARTLGGAVGGIVGTFTSFWESIPEPMRNLLVTGFAGEHIVKWLFGFDPAGAAFGALKNALVSGVASGMGKSLVAAGIGKLFVQPVWVTNKGFGGLPSVPGLPGEIPVEGATGSLLSFLAAGAIPMTISAIAPLALVALTDAIIGGADKIAANDLAGRGATAAARGLDPTKIALPGNIPRAGISPELAAANAAQADEKAAHAATLAAGGIQRFYTQADLAAAGVHNFAGAASNASASLTASAAHLNRVPDWLKRWEAALHPLNALSKRIASAIGNIGSGHAVDASARFLLAHLGVGGVGAGGLFQAEAALKALKTALPRAVGTERRDIVAAIAAIEKRLPRLEDNHKNLRLAERIARSNETQQQKLADLDKVMADVKAHGDRTTQSKIQALINDVKKLKFTAHITIPITVKGSQRIVMTATNTVGGSGGGNYGYNPDTRT